MTFVSTVILYVYRILKVLLNELIDKKIAANEPKLFLRRYSSATMLLNVLQNILLFCESTYQNDITTVVFKLCTVHMQHGRISVKQLMTLLHASYSKMPRHMGNKTVRYNQIANISWAIIYVILGLSQYQRSCSPIGCPSVCITTWRTRQAHHCLFCIRPSRYRWSVAQLIIWQTVQNTHWQRTRSTQMLM